MKKQLAFLSIILLNITAVSSQCNFVVMFDTTSQYTPQLVYTEEISTGYKTYIRKYYSNLANDDPRQGVYVQERDRCMKILSESMFLSVADFPNGIYRADDFLYFYPSLIKDYLWINFNTTCIHFNVINRTYKLYKPEINMLLSNTNFIQLPENKFCLSYGSGGVYILDSQFHVISKFRSVYSPIRRLDSNRLFLKHLPIQRPLFTEDSSIILSDIDGRDLWTYSYPRLKMPFFYDYEFSERAYYLIGSSDPDGNNVASNPVIYKLDTKGNILATKSIETNIFKAAYADHSVLHHEYLFIAGSQTVSRKPKERRQSFIAKLDTNLNLVWKIDLDLGCGPVYSECKSITGTKDGGALYTYAGSYYGDTCNPMFIKVDTDGNITSSQESINQMEVKVYPNPVHDILTFNTIEVNSIMSYRIYDITGSNYFVELQGKELNLSKLPAGMYFLSVELSDHRKVTKRIIKY